MPIVVVSEMICSLSFFNPPLLCLIIYNMKEIRIKRRRVAVLLYVVEAVSPIMALLMMAIDV
jgi:hypothetical protein